MANRIRLAPQREIRQILNMFAGATAAVAEEVAKNVRDQGIKVGDKDGGKHEIDLPVTVKMVKTDRPHALVTIAHPSGQAVQSKHGALTKAAAQAGLDVRSKK